MSVAFVPGAWRGVSGSHDGTVRVWDLATGKVVGKFEGHAGWVKRVAVSADGRYALSGGDDRLVRLWRLPDLPARK
jgi:WD40 repeat protein